MFLALSIFAFDLVKFKAKIRIKDYVANNSPFIY